MAVSLKDIARLCGVSTATVSRTLSQPDRVSAATRDQILAVVKAEGYRINSSARALRRQRTDTVLAVAPDLGNPFFSQIFRGLQDGLLEQGCDLLVFDSTSGRDHGRSFLAHLREGRADRLVCLDGRLTDDVVAEMRAPDLAGRIVFACEWLPGDGFASIRSDNRGGMALAVRHLVGLGHGRIGYVGGPSGNILEWERRAGLGEELERQGLALDPGHICAGRFDYEAGQAAAPRILAMVPRPTAVVCASDTIAIGLISALSALGVNVPRDLSVTGFDDIAPAPFSVPPLTTIRQDRRRLGTEAARVLLRLIRRTGSEPPIRGDVTVIPVAFVERGTTAPPR